MEALLRTVLHTGDTAKIQIENITVYGAETLMGMVRHLFCCSGDKQDQIFIYIFIHIYMYICVYVYIR